MKTFVTGGSGFVGRNLIKTLVKRGDHVNALARSAQSIQIVQRLGANPIEGDLDNVEAMVNGMQGCDIVYHCAVNFIDLERSVVVGTKNVINASKQAKIPRFVHVSTEAVLADGNPIINADETVPKPLKPVGEYSRTKGIAENIVLEANVPGEFDCVIVRPRFIWGRDDSTLLPEFAKATHTGELVWFSGGNYRTSTCHIDNCIEGMLLAAEKGKSGEIYFLTDGEPVIFREFLSQLLTVAGVTPPTRSVPLWLIWSFATVAETYRNAKAWLGFGGNKFGITRQTVALMGQEVTVSDQKARRELGYKTITTIEEGLKTIVYPPVTEN
eukprot:TRINITY_DN4815_c0_g1_i1.p1 TRINITY_DN4815_c0_g1~~TRINITY_DN4815_c0_g1_i1.p1  ORF type:complete len:327 (-),score=52.48 TRINITY_DN4815_c0_g1_i1:145-1125(-)